MQILALHGFTGCGSDFVPFAPLIGGDWHCPDLPGHGPDPQLDCSPEATVNFIKEEHSTFKVQSSKLNVLLGYSMGARAALQHAVDYPNAWDALVLISPNPGIEDEAARAARRATDAKLAERIERQGAAAFIEFWQQTPMIRSQQSIRPDWRETMQAARQKHTATGLANSLRQFGQGSVPDLWSGIDQLRMPICLITGALDRKYTKIAQRMCCQLPQAIHQTIHDSGHAPHLENTERYIPVLQNFLNIRRNN